ncbi:unnamed protein product [Candidula unifasciata]|uniref:Ankyrin repeat domain-containing protein 54 n=1 Tax=Candidula unifasciata TaxID=100452 RepID=A0A8S3YIX8_9EUPU|nr:unnamed protein product [Candidula unifasciata]
MGASTVRRRGERAQPLFFCCSRGYLELAKLLLEKGASVASTDKNLATPLHGAVDNGHIEVVKLLISHGANINSQNYRGDTPLHLAAYRGFTDITQCLIKAGADFRLVNSNSFTAENEALGRGHLELCNYLRTAQNDRADLQSFDSMIQLDPPMVTPVTCHQQTDTFPKKDTYRQQEKQPSEQDEVSVRHLAVQTVKNFRSKSCDYETDMYKNLSVIALDPPSEVNANVVKGSQHKINNCRHSTGRLAPMVMLPSTHVTLAEQLSPNSSTLAIAKTSHCRFINAIFVSTISHDLPGCRIVWA